MSKQDIAYGLAVIILGAPGFWQYFLNPIIERARKKKTPQDAALIGLLYERIFDLCEMTEAAWNSNGEGISRARYNWIVEHLLQPYLDLGGNHDAEERVYNLRMYIDER